MTSGLSAAVVSHLKCDPQYPIAALGNASQANAAPLTGEMCWVTSATAGVADSVRLPALANFGAGWILVRNDSGATINVYPAPGEKLNLGAANVGATVTNGMGKMFLPITGTQWLTNY